ncbi:MAG: MFS transporter [Caldilineaceae bacterium]|nr:MFS transporter [Caldilineaceae bacterium]
MATATRTSRLINHTPFFYGWVILVAGTISIAMMGPSQTFTVGLFIDTWVAQLGISRSNIALIYGVSTLSASLFLPVTGRMTDRRGARTMIAVVGVGLGLSCIVMGQVNGVLSLLLGLLALRFFGFGSVQLVSNHAIAQWFIHKRGTVMGLAGQSLALGLFIFPVLGEALINIFGWRGAWVAMGLMAMAVLILVGWTFFRDTPELYGQVPDGRHQPASTTSRPQPGATGTNARDTDSPRAEEVNWTLAEARGTALFWIFAVGLASMTLVMAGMAFHQVSLFAARGFPRETAIRAFQISALTSIVGNLGIGRLLDLVSARKLLATVLLLLASTLILLVVMSAPWHAALFGALYGVISGSYRVMDSTVWAKYYGRRHLGEIRGATMIGTLGGTAFGAYPLALSYDLLNSYTPALMAFLLLPLALAAVALMARRPEKR